MRLLITAAAAAFTVFAAPSWAGPVEDYEALREEVWQATLDGSPQLATSVGDRRGDGLLGDLSLAQYERDVEEARAHLARLGAIDEDALPVDLQIDYAVLQSSLEDFVAASEHDHTKFILFTNRGGWFSGFASLLSLIHITEPTRPY